MIPVEVVNRINWSLRFGRSLKKARGDMSLRELSDRLAERGQKVSHQYLNQLEKGEHETADFTLIDNIRQIVDVDLSDILPIISIESSIPS